MPVLKEFDPLRLCTSDYSFHFIIFFFFVLFVLSLIFEREMSMLYAAWTFFAHSASLRRHHLIIVQY